MNKIYSFVLWNGQSGTQLKIDSLPIQVGSLEYRLMEYLHQPQAAMFKVQKHTLCRIFDLEGSHEEHETKRKRTSMRKMQQVIRNLRYLNVPIVSHIRQGIWIANTVEEVADYCDWLKRKYVADYISMRDTRDVLCQMVQIKQQPINFDEL